VAEAVNGDGHGEHPEGAHGGGDHHEEPHGPFDPELMEELERFALVPLIELERAEDALPIADAFLSAGLPVLEIALRTPDALQAIEKLAAYSELLLGAGTVCTKEQAQRAAEAGAAFLVSPGFDRELVEWCLEWDMPILPGVATPSEAMAAQSLGLEVVKLFPAEALGGVRYLKALAAPFPGLRFVPTGGIAMQQIGEYLALPQVYAVGGSFLCPRELLRSRSWDALRRLVEEALRSRR
jgi:2-dehydro-3-deoxyphosphogluconate aldolase/(4S)-4-hydroxy-2-oxoglutarate aldolase